MSYNKPRITISKKDTVCSKCLKIISRGEYVYLEPGKFIIHAKCKPKNNAQ